MNGVGIHTYAGGFVLGARKAGIEIAGSYETYKAPMRIAYAVGVQNLIGTVIPRVDLVIANPPCSRFSHMSVGTFTTEERRLDAFPELNEVFQCGLAADAGAVWWESGPLATSIGKETLVDCHLFFEREWGKVTTVVVSFDLLYAGWPQRRPRTHILHFKGDLPVPGMPKSRWNSEIMLKPWLKNNAAPGEPLTPYYTNLGGYLSDPRSWVAYEHLRKGGFRSTLPILYTDESQSSMSMIGARYYGWYEENQWWSINDYMTVMGYPQDVNYEALETEPSRRFYVHGISGKSVSPCASEYIATNLLIPMFEGQDTRGEVSAVSMQTPGMFYHDLRVKGYKSIFWKPEQKDYVQFERTKKCS